MYDQHKFGYNPEELSGIFQGVLQVIAGRQQLTGNFENQQREIIGHLEAKVTTRRKTDKRSETVKLIEQPLLTISETSNNLADGSKKNNADSSVRL